MNHDQIQAKINAALNKATEGQKAAALKDATSFINSQFKFRGEPRTRLQGLEWPRKNAFFNDGTPILGVPEAVKEATAQLACFMLADVPMNVETMAVLLAILDPVIEEKPPH